jgi:hypothetical protein
LELHDQQWDSLERKGRGRRGARGGRRLQDVGEEGRGAIRGAAQERVQSMVTGSLFSCAGSSCELFLREVEEKRKEKRDKRKGRKKGKEKEKWKKIKPDTFRGEK